MCLRVFVFAAIFGASMLAMGSARAATFTLADLVAGGGTTSFTSDDGTLTFGDFEVTRLKRLSGDLSRYVITTTANGFALTSTEFDVAGGGLRKLGLSYTVTATSPIVQAALDLDATVDTGKVLVVKDLDAHQSDDGSFLVARVTGAKLDPSDSDQFAPGVLSFDVEESLRIKRVARVDAITNSFQVVPEPTAAVLLGAGLGGLVWLGRRRSAA